METDKSLILMNESDLIVPQQGESGTTLTATVSEEISYTREFTWDISKSATPNEWNLFYGDTGISEYNIFVVKNEPIDKAFVSGQVCVTNGGAVATENLAITLDVQLQPNTPVITGAVVNVTGNPVLDPGETGCYIYNVQIPAGFIVQGGVYKVTAHVTITNHSGHLGTPFGPNPSATATLPAVPTLINDTIHVMDDGRSFTFSTSGNASYSVNYSCPGDGGTHTNTATIVETGQTATATVKVNCYQLDVSKTANTSFTRTYNWDIVKSADQSNITLAIGQTFLVNYTLSVNKTNQDSNWMAYGIITIKNPAPIPVIINSVADIIEPDIAANVMCGVTFPFILAAGSQLICNYSANLPNGMSRNNTATATIQNYVYGPTGSKVPSGTTNFTGSALINFANATINEINRCVSVGDTFGGMLGNVCAGDVLPRQFIYNHQVGPYGTCGNYQVTNTAVVVSNSIILDQDTWTVNVNVQCNGCTRTIGYWKTHPEFIGQYLPIFLGTVGGTNTLNVNTVSMAVNILQQNVYGTPLNGITKLYAQLLAAKLNGASGADLSAISSTIAAADAFLAQYNFNAWDTTLTKPQRQQVLGWVTILDNYNNGLTGPGHCSE